VKLLQQQIQRHQQKKVEKKVLKSMMPHFFSYSTLKLYYIFWGGTSAVREATPPTASGCKFLIEKLFEWKVVSFAGA
jgi:hypothetical protein